ncbi:hypothetical protein Mapa_006439 [Marchantia paleacea]|nr:hypothetical protein Mapa_006439 [Marchantia paleacea]
MRERKSRTCIFDGGLMTIEIEHFRFTRAFITMQYQRQYMVSLDRVGLYLENPETEIEN